MTIKIKLKIMQTFRQIPLWGLLGMMLLSTLSFDSMAQTGSTADEVVVQTYPDTQSAGWAYKTGDEAFVGKKDGCRIQWNVVQYKNEKEKRHIEVRKKCALALTDQVPIHRAILNKIISKYPPSTLDSLSWGRFSQPPDWSWCTPIAVASTQSAAYADYRKNYPNSKITSLNTLFVQLANETQAYKDLKQVFEPFGAGIRLTGVEKVFAMSVKELPEAFSSKLKQHGLKKDTRVMYDVGMSYFKIIH